MGKNKWVLEQISTLQFMVTDAWELSSKPLGLVGQPLLVQLVLCCRVRWNLMEQLKQSSWQSFGCVDHASSPGGGSCQTKCMAYM